MGSISLKKQILPLTVLTALLVIAAITVVANQRVTRERRAFSIKHFEKLMQRIDVAIESISDTMVQEGLAADIEALLQRPEPVPEDVMPAQPEALRGVVLDFTGVAWNPRMPLAFINGMTVGKGDRIGNAEIIHIGKESVSVRYADQTEQTLTLTSDDE